MTVTGGARANQSAGTGTNTTARHLHQAEDADEVARREAALAADYAAHHPKGKP